MTARVRRWSDVDPHALARSHDDIDHLHPMHSTAAATTATAASAAPVSMATMVHTPAVHVAADDVQECVICLDDLAFGKALFTAECGHRFHFSCLLENVNHDEANADKCPICRKAQTQWPQQTKGLVKAHPFCTNCGKRGTGGPFCDGCGNSLAHTPTAAERARIAAATAAARSNVVVECPTCRIRCLVSTSARGTLQCPNGHLFQLRMPPAAGGAGPPMMPTAGNSQLGPSSNGTGMRVSFAGGSNGTSNSAALPGGPPPPSMQQQSGPPAGPPGLSGDARLIMRQCPTCYTRVQMPPGSQAGQYMCPHGHTFYFSPVTDWRPYQ